MIKYKKGFGDYVCEIGSVLFIISIVIAIILILISFVLVDIVLWKTITGDIIVSLI